MTVYERVAFENPEEVTPKPWLTSFVRAEGLTVVALSVMGGKGYAWLLNLTGAAGAAALFFPRQYLAFSSIIAYENPETAEWNDRFIPLVRFFGIVYLFLAAKSIDDATEPINRAVTWFIWTCNESGSSLKRTPRLTPR